MARPKLDDPLVFITVGLRKSEWEFVQLWRDNDESPTRNLSELIERCRKFWPSGPNVVGREVKRSRKRAPAVVRSYAAKRGLTWQEALADIAAKYVTEHPEQFKKE